MGGGTSYNGWPCSSDPSAIDVEHFGDAQGFPFPGGVRGGDVATVLGYVATQLHHRVEPCVNGYCWGYEYRENVNNPGNLSCHASATAIDWNAPFHGNGGPAYAGFDDAQVSTIYQILDEVQGAVQWGADYDGTKDPMHFEIIVDASTLARVAASLGGISPAPDPTPDAPPEDDDMMQLLQVENSPDGKIYAASISGGVFYWVPSGDNMQAGQLAGLYSQDVKVVNDGQMNHIRWSCLEAPPYTDPI